MRLSELSSFNSWFSGSKVVDKSGKPLRMYHVTKNEFEHFAPGSHFGSATAARHRFSDLTNNFRSQSTDFRTYPVYLSIKHPLRVEDLTASDEATLFNYIKRHIKDEKFKNFDLDYAWKEGCFKALEKMGYDGLVYNNDMEDIGKDSWVIFRPDQVRYALSLNESTIIVPKTGINFVIHKNPSKQQYFKMNGYNGFSNFKGLVNNADFYVWDAWHAHHSEITNVLGLDVTEDNTVFLYFNFDGMYGYTKNPNLIWKNKHLNYLYNNKIPFENQYTIEESQLVILEARLPIALKGLAAEAKKCKTFAEFKHDYLMELKHGVYWHITKNPNFFIDPETGPRDMSSMGTGYLSKGKLMITSHLDYWADFYEETRKYAALIDMTEVPRNDYYQVNRGYGNEFFVTDPSKAKVVKVMPIKKAIALDKAWNKKMPNSEQELKYFYEEWHGDDYQNFYTELPDIKSGGAPYVVRQIDEDNFKVFKNGHEIAHARLGYNRKYVIDLYVQKEYRRKGIASALYKYIENVLGYKLEPSTIHQTDDGEMFWKSRH